LVADCQISDPVPPLWFLTTSTAYSTSGPRVCCNSCRPWGLVRFKPVPPHRQAASDLPVLGRRDHSRTRVHTPRRIPLVRSRTASLRPLPSCRSVTAGMSTLTPARMVPKHAPRPKPRSLGDDTPFRCSLSTRIHRCHAC
jgi:hypothetical protein